MIVLPLQAQLLPSSPLRGWPSEGEISPQPSTLVFLPTLLPLTGWWQGLLGPKSQPQQKQQVQLPGHPGHGAWNGMSKSWHLWLAEHGLLHLPTQVSQSPGHEVWPPEVGCVSTSCGLLTTPALQSQWSLSHCHFLPFLNSNWCHTSETLLRVIRGHPRARATTEVTQV